MTAAIIRAHDWASTPLGSSDSWRVELRTLVSVMLGSNQPMFVVWGSGRTLIYNDPYAEILAAKHPAAMGRDFLEVWHEIRPDLEGIVAQAYQGEPVQMDDITLFMERRGYREETHFSFSYTPMRDGNDIVTGFFCTCTEITAQVMAERRLRESETRLRGVLDGMGEAFGVLDRDFRILEFNAEAMRLESRRPDEIVGRSHWEAYPGSEESELGRLYKRAMAGRVPFTHEHRYVWPDGTTRWLDVRAYPVSEGLAVFWRDISDRKRAEAEARAAAERVELALNAGAIVGTWVWDVPEDRFTADERFAHSFGLDPVRCRRGLPLDEVTASIHPEDLPHVVGAIAEALRRGGPYRCDYRVRGVDGAYRWTEANGRVELDAAGRPRRFPGVLIDISDRRRVEEERDRASALLRAFIDAVPGVVYAKDRGGRMLVANRGTAELIGKSPAEFLGKTDAEFLEDEAQAEAIMATDRRIMESGIAEQVEEAVSLPDGTPAVWFSTKAPMRDAAGEVIGLIGASIDITARKQAEELLARGKSELERLVAERTRDLEETQARLAHAQRMEALGQLAGGIAHDFNNVLQAVAGGAALVARRAEDPAGVRRLARMISEAADRGSAVTRRLLAFARRSDLRAEAIRPADLLSGLGDVLSHTLGAGIAVRVEAPPGLPLLLADKGQLETVLVNLATNARDAMDGQGTLTLAAAVETMREGSGLGISADLAPGDYLHLTVADTGAGMPAEVLARAAEPFFTTKAPGKGTGLGLAMARGFAEQSGGGLHIRSAPGRGTTVSLWLPVAREGAAASDRDRPRAPVTADHAGRRILLVDDEAAVREVLAEGLSAAGYTVLQVENGNEALALLRRESVDLLVTDLSMPGPDGVATIREAQRLRPGLPAILLTGFATGAAELAIGGAVSGTFSLLRKPVSAEAIAERVAVLLEGRAVAAGGA